MSGFEMSSSGVPSGPDVAEPPGGRGVLTQTGHRMPTAVPHGTEDTKVRALWWDDANPSCRNSSHRLAHALSARTSPYKGK